MNLIRWNDPFRDLAALQNRLNRAFDSTLARPARQRGGALHRDVGSARSTSSRRRTRRSSRPSCPASTRTRSSSASRTAILSLEGERKFEKENGDENYHRVERSYGKFVRSFTIPSNVDNEKIAAAFDNGVLTVELPKREETKPKQIQIKRSGAARSPRSTSKKK